MRARWWPLLLLSGCVPDLANECAGEGDCPVDRPVCFAGVCAAEAQETEASDAFVFTGFGGAHGDAGAPDAFVFTGFDRDAGVADAAPAPPAPDAAPARDGSDCITETCNGRDDDCDDRVDEDPGECRDGGRGRGRGRGRGHCDDDCDEDADE